MMGRSHVTISALVWIAAAPTVAAQAGRPMNTTVVLASAFCCAGAALWPDWDHPQATLAHTIGPFTQLLSRVIGGLAGGHRHGTHTLAFCVLAGAATTLLSALPARVGDVSLPVNWGALALVWFLAYTVMLTLGLTVGRGRGLGDGIYAVQAVAVVAVVERLVPGQWWWLPWAVGVGCLLHCVQDMLTSGGLTWFWRPISRAPARIPCCGDTGGPGEALLAGAAGLGLLWVSAAVIAGHSWWHTGWLPL